MRTRAKTLDLTRNLGAVVRLGTSIEAVDTLLQEALDALGDLVPFDLATVMEITLAILGSTAVISGLMAYCALYELTGSNTRQS